MSTLDTTETTRRPFSGRRVHFGDTASAGRRRRRSSRSCRPRRPDRVQALQGRTAGALDVRSRLPHAQRLGSGPPLTSPRERSSSARSSRRSVRSCVATPHLGRHRALSQRARPELDSWPGECSRRDARRDPERRDRLLGDHRARSVAARSRRPGACTPLSAGFLSSATSSAGANYFTAIVVLTIMITPIIASLSRELFLGVPRELKEAALGLGMTRWEMVRGVVLPYTRGGVAAAMILGLGRALGEAIACLARHRRREPPSARTSSAQGDTIGRKIATQFLNCRTTVGAVRSHLPRPDPSRPLLDRESPCAADRAPREPQAQGLME